MVCGARIPGRQLVDILLKEGGHGGGKIKDINAHILDVKKVFMREGPCCVIKI